MASALLDTLRRRRAVSGEAQRLAAAALAAGPARDPDDEHRLSAAQFGVRNTL